MSCDPLPNTGVAHLPLFLVLALLLFTAGALALFLARSRHAGAGAALLVLILVGLGVDFASGPPAQAASSDCPTPGYSLIPGNSVTPENSLTITQTSALLGLAPGIAPMAITGIVVNNGPDSTFIANITVEIISVTSDPDASPGGCIASDYILFRRQMPVGQILRPGGSTPFSGASIGFNNKITNQDGCQLATIHLRYTANRQ